MLMSQVPATDRPRERLAERGAEALGDRELLTLLLNTGIRGKGAHEVAEFLLNQSARWPGSAGRRWPSCPR